MHLCVQINTISVRTDVLAVTAMQVSNVQAGLLKCWEIHHFACLNVRILKSSLTMTMHLLDQIQSRHCYPLGSLVKRHRQPINKSLTS